VQSEVGHDSGATGFRDDATDAVTSPLTCPSVRGLLGLHNHSFPCWRFASADAAGSAQWAA